MALFARIRLTAICLLFMAPSAGAVDLVGRPVPDLHAVDLRRQPIALAEWRGNRILVTFWATWCRPCREELPRVQKVYDRYRARGFRVVAVNVGEGREDVTAYIDKAGLTFPIVLDPDGDAAARFGALGLPTSYVIDAEGIVRAEITGAGLTEARLEAIARD